jgi:hypothetical protein
MTCTACFYTLDGSSEGCNGLLCAGLRTRNLDVKALQAVFELLQSHYPERLHALWFLNAPFIFWGVWRMVRFLFHEAASEVPSRQWVMRQLKGLCLHYEMERWYCSQRPRSIWP